MPKEVKIEASYVGDQPLISVLEANLDPEKVTVTRNQYAVKALFPIEILITAVSLHAFEKLVLDPILEPLAEKFDWVAATRKLLRPHQPFNITVRIRDQHLIEAPLDLDHALVAEVWQVLRRTIDTLRAEALLEKTTMIRITSDAPGSPLVIAYHGSRPCWQVLLTEGRTLPIAGLREEP